ncbi:hypothetical protein O0I10_009871 [Lichtheimia ornata]|uniref:Uncharacterized protein n=1 Tax=Lichtheimia ornata TaxID=688661 RepID=A0AAD7UW98_9FUNG|nr:uncharacterized protein O0I10_009871 [Lichtheimia ornata]KAJ8654430.1 hypothetical protein O0I10_009871 [Lichtheimia ornata]
MKFSALVLATAAIIATANAIRGFDVGESCTAIKVQATCEEHACKWDVASNGCMPVPDGGKLRGGVAF